MSKLYQYIALSIMILFLTACVGSSISTKENETNRTDSNLLAVDAAGIAAMNSSEKINYAEKLFESAQTRNDSEQLLRLNRALLIASQILIDAHQFTLSHIPDEADIRPEQYDTALQLVNKLILQLNTLALSAEQKNQYLLSLSTLSLVNGQPEKTLLQLNQSFDSSLSELWSMYHQLRALSEFQLNRQEQAVKELIIRHGYLATEQEKQSNQYLIWNFLAGLNPDNSDLIALRDKTDLKHNNTDRIYLGWLELTRLLRDAQDPQTLSYAINFWIQNYPSHQADRTFIRHILDLRQASIINIKQIAVLLPLQGKFAKPARAIQDGIIASHYQAPLTADLQLRFYDTSQVEHIWLSYQEAIDNGADFIIGPLAKNNLELLAESAELTVPTLALNSLESAETSATKNIEAGAPSISETASEKMSRQKIANLFQFSLSPESSARMVAEKARQDGHYYAAIMTPDNSWGKRMQKAFASHWKKLGGVIIDTIDYTSQANDFSDTIKSLLKIDKSEARKQKITQTIGQKLEFTPRRRQDIDMIFMAAHPKQAKQIPLQITYHHGETIPVYSTAHIVANYHNSRENIDMDGVIFSDMPFLLGTSENSISLQKTFQNTLYHRLFAMGVDSYQLAPHVNYLYQNPSESFSGDTGRITINHNGEIIRSLPWATFEKGDIKLQQLDINQNNASVY